MENWKGIVQEVEYSARKTSPFQKALNFAGNQAAIHRLAKPSDNPGQSWQIRLIKAGKILQAKQSSLSIQWVPGHEDILGNEEADKLAKQAAKFSPDSYITSLAMVRSKIKSLVKKEWCSGLLEQYSAAAGTGRRNYFTTYPARILRQIQIPRATPKKISSALYQLTTGHGYNNPYLFRFKLRDWDTCSCGEVQTPEQLLLHCIWYKDRRKRAFKDVKNHKPTIQQLFLSIEGRAAILDRINTNCISTREWILYGDKEEEGEEEEEGKEEEEGEEGEQR